MLRPVDNRLMCPRRRVAILGCTGSIGRQALDVVRSRPEQFEVVGLTAHSNATALEALATDLGVAHRGLGPAAAAEIARLPDVDVVLNAVVGAAGLAASLAALEDGKVLALANKESLVAGGALCLEAALRGSGTIVPVDSEHAALAQCLEGRERATVRGLVLTASGGPFRSRADLAQVRPSDALAHPTWTMGPKITIDSATLMNKGLEVIEAHHLFGFAFDAIRVVVHPQSIVHAAVELVDGSMVLQAAIPDMRLPIQAALGAPERTESLVASVDLARVGSLDFEPVDDRRFGCLALAYEAGRAGGSFPTVLNAANEEAVGAFLAESIAFTDIEAVIAEVLGRHVGEKVECLEDVMEVDAWTRDVTRRALAARSQPISARN
jgi:1-deoxy-D-xylulose-5-phosphate reductoisomerase